MSPGLCLQPLWLLCLSALLLCSALRPAAAAEKNSQLRSPSLRQLQSIISFLPRQQKCNQLLLHLMKDCVGSDDPPPTVSSTSRPLPKTSAAPLATFSPVKRAAPLDDEDASMAGSGAGPEPLAPQRRLPERSRPAAAAAAALPAEPLEEKEKKDRKRSRKERAVKRKMKRSTSEKPPHPKESDPKAKRMSWEEAHNLGPDFFKYMGMG